MSTANSKNLILFILVGKFFISVYSCSDAEFKINANVLTLLKFWIKFSFVLVLKVQYWSKDWKKQYH